MQDTNLNKPDPFIDAKHLLDSMIDALHTQKWLDAEHRPEIVA